MNTGTSSAIDRKCIEDVGRRAEGRLERGLLLGDVEPIEAVEVSEFVVALEQQSFPVVLRLDLRQRKGAFDHHDPRTTRAGSPGGQGASFGSLDVDLEPMDHVARTGIE